MFLFKKEAKQSYNITKLNLNFLTRTVSKIKLYIYIVRFIGDSKGVGGRGAMVPPPKRPEKNDRMV